MAISKATIKAIGVSALLIFLYSLTLLLYLWSKYDSIGDCAAIVYYNPISFKDIIYMAFIGMFWYGVSLFLLKKTKKLYITEGAIYVLLLFGRQHNPWKPKDALANRILSTANLFKGQNTYSAVLSLLITMSETFFGGKRWKKWRFSLWFYCGNH